MTTKYKFPPKDELQKIYAELGSLSKVAKKLRCDYNSLDIYFKELGIKPNYQSKLRLKNLPPKEKLIALYEKVGSINALAKHLKCSSSAIRIRLAEYQVPLITQKSFQFPPKEKLEQLYWECGSKKALAKLLGCSLGTLRWYFKTKIKINTLPPERTPVNDNFFASDTERSFYWAGFIAADGCILDNKLVIDISSKDAKHLELFAEHIETERQVVIKNIWNEEVQKFCKKALLSITSEQIVNDLKRFNILPRKGGLNVFPYWLTKHPLCHHFIRGLIDGDGCFCKRSHRNNIIFNLAGSKQTISSIQTFLTEICDLPKNKLSLKPRSVTYNYIPATLSYYGNFDVWRLKDYIYKNATVFLPRKKNIADKVEKFVLDNYYKSGRATGKNSKKNTLWLIEKITEKAW